MTELPHLPFDAIIIIADHADPCTQARLARVCRRLRDRVYGGRYGVDGPKLRHYNIAPGLLTNGSPCVHVGDTSVKYALPNGDIICRITKSLASIGHLRVYKRRFYLHDRVIEEVWHCKRTADLPRRCRYANTNIHENKGAKREIDNDHVDPPLKRALALVSESQFD